MISVIFFTVLRTLALPIVVILILKESFLGLDGAFLGVVIAITISNIISLGWKVLKIIGNTVLLRGKSVIILILKIAIEILSTAGFWAYYFLVINKI